MNTHAAYKRTHYNILSLSLYIYNPTAHRAMPHSLIIITILGPHDPVHPFHRERHPRERLAHPQLTRQSRPPSV